MTMEDNNPYKEKGRVPLRIDNRTVALVRPENATREYADKLRSIYRRATGSPIPARYLGDYI